MQESEKVTIKGVFLNIMLFCGKLAVGIISNSLAVMSDAFNSLTDIISYTVIYFAVKTSNKKADDTHPFGHRRAEPIAGLIVAVFAGILAFEIFRSAVFGLFSPRVIKNEMAAVAILLFTIFIKILMAIYFTRKGNKLDRPAIRAAGIDSKNDVLASSVALIGIVGVWIGVPILDSVAAMFISIFIFYSGYKIGVENIDYLMGKAPPEKQVKSMKKAALAIKGVKGLNEVKAHYVGNFVHVEIHVEVDKNLSTQQSHDLGKKVQFAVEKLSHVDKAFVHIDPV